jgi:hypothetical protein
VSDEQTRHENDLKQLEKRLLSAFQDPVTDAEVMARTHRRLREAMVSGARPSRRRLASAFGPIAASLALVMVAGVVGWRLAGQRGTTEHPVKPSATAKTVPTAAVVDPLNCKLPVLVLLQAGPPGQQRREAGFIDTHSGKYAQDGSASVAGLPGGGSGAIAGKPAQPPTPVSYSASLGRWLPVGGDSIAPDGRSYLWVRLLPEGSAYGPNNFQKAELHVYDVVSSTDRTLWTYPGSISVFGWDASGILLETTPPIIRVIPQPGMPLWWLVDPQTGNATQQAIAPGQHPRLTQLPGDPRNQNGLFVYSGFAFGAEFQGHTLFRIGSRDPGSVVWVLYETAPGRRVTIYRGVQGDALNQGTQSNATSFDPSVALSDATGIWFGDYSGHELWRWQPASGLQKVLLSGLPSPIVGPPNSYVFVDPAGPCM